MDRRLFAFVATLAVAAFVSAVPFQFVPHTADSWLVGSATAVLNPPVGGRTDYVVPMDEFNTDNPGTLVLAFDQGTIPVGNGASESHWVRDDIRASVMCIRGADGATVVMVHSDLYMLFDMDLEDYYTQVRQAVGSDVYSTLRFVVSATHNHHGPDTTGLSGLNRDWYAWMLVQMSQTTVRALNNMRPANLRVASREWRFGVDDVRDPLLLDPSLNVLQATELGSGRVIATLVQWAFHPECTLGYSPKAPEADCLALGLSYPCSSNGRYLTADFPGHLINYLREYTQGGDVLYMSGALGVQIGPHGPVWEVSEQYPIIGDGAVPPTGAAVLPRSFRIALLVGRELAKAAFDVIGSSKSQDIPYGRIDFREEKFYSHLTNLLFRAGMAPSLRNPEIPFLLGYRMRKLYNCPYGVLPTDENCVFDNFETIETREWPAPIRKGNFAVTKTSFFQIGQAAFGTIPGELSPELAHGVPSDFDTPEGIAKYYHKGHLHAVGPNYTMPGVMKDMMKCEFCFIFCLTHDASGYLLPLADFWMGCKQSPVCTAEGYIKGETCKQIIETGASLGRSNCLIGQTDQWETHYEEIMSVGWDMAADFINAFARAIGVRPSGRYTKPDWRQ
eukprot:TRINITY_DN17285_c0_g1_i1.p1 TRINITY_DN17285_c0_g1~~TRINITY_DN17285_c0_g1_i1.p1  ORF type:complete len:617 (-),score=127.58 TRINITY_DN17285_c0_g1_i1:140-1990(-)